MVASQSFEVTIAGGGDVALGVVEPMGALPQGVGVVVDDGTDHEDGVTVHHPEQVVPLRVVLHERLDQSQPIPSRVGGEPPLVGDLQQLGLLGLPQLGHPFGRGAMCVDSVQCTGGYPRIHTEHRRANPGGRIAASATGSLPDW